MRQMCRKSKSQISGLKIDSILLFDFDADISVHSIFPLAIMRRIMPPVKIYLFTQIIINPTSPTSTEYIKQDEGILLSNCSRQLNVHHLIQCTVLYSTAVSSEILFKYRQCGLMWKFI